MSTAYTNAVGAYGSDDEVTDTYTYAAFPLGTYREEDGVGYRFSVMDDGATAAVVGRRAYFTGADFTVTATIANGTRLSAGDFVSVIPTSGYGWIKVKGAKFLTE